jgi:LPS export ABC transporter protein LptC
MNWRWIAASALLAAFLVTYGIFVGREPLLQDAAAPPPPLPGYYLKDAVITETLPNGEPHLRLAARSIQQSPKDDSIQLRDMTADYYGSQGGAKNGAQGGQLGDKRWGLSADQGFIPANSRTLELSGNVVLRQLDSPVAPVAHTEYLLLDTARNTAKTSASVRIDIAENSVKAKGLEADLKTGNVKLLANINGQFNPK